MSSPSFTFGPDYPAILTYHDGTAMPLVRERRWSRVYQHPDTHAFFRIPRLLDGSSTISLGELRAGWPTWTSEERLDFCQNTACLREQDDFPDMLRLLMQQGDTFVWRAIALSVAMVIPRDEAFGILSSALNSAEPYDRTNVLQALARTRHPAAGGTIRGHLAQVLARPEVWEGVPSYNEPASTAVYAVKYLLELGADPAEFESIVRSFADHPNPGIRDTCRGWLRSRYPFLSENGSG